MYSSYSLITFFCNSAVLETIHLSNLEAFVSSKMNIKSLMLPKVKTPDEITFIDDLLTDCGLDTNLHVIIS